MTSPRVSVLLPVRDGAATLGSALASIARQTLADHEVVVAVDAASGDGSAAVAARHAARDRRVTVVRAAGRGIVAVLNEGLAACHAPLVARMDADDVSRRDRLCAQVGLLDRCPDLAAAGCGVRLLAAAPPTEGRRRYLTWLNSLRDAADIARERFVECPVAHPALVIRRDALGAGYRDAGWPEDYDLVLRVVESGGRIGVVPRRLLAWRDGPSRASRTDPRYAIERFTACKAHFLARGPLRDHEHYVLWGFGNTGRALCRALRALGRWPAAVIEVDPRRLGQRIHGAPVVRPEELPDVPRLPVLVSLAGAANRAVARSALAAIGRAEDSDYWCVA